MKIRSLKAGDFIAIGIAVILVAFGLYAAVNHLNTPRQGSYHPNFGPDWDCSSRGSICIKRSPVPTAPST
jgi:hypothetical protein